LKQLLNQIVQSKDKSQPVIVQLRVLLKAPYLFSGDVFSNNGLGVVMLLTEENCVKSGLLEIVGLELCVEFAK